MTSSPICYLEIPAPDIEKAETFYSTVFGWKITPSDLGVEKYSMFGTGENQLMGGLDASKPVQDGGIIIYIKVDNIDTTLVMVKGEGGSVVRDKHDIGGGHGFSATFKDSNGNHIGLWAES